MEQQTPPQFADFNVESVEDTEKKIILKNGNLKLSFFKTKLDGTESKAFTTFKTLGYLAGKTIKVGVVEEPGEFKDDKGATKNFFYHNIIWLGQPDGQAQYQPPAYPQTQTPAPVTTQTPTPQVTNTPQQTPAEAPTGTIPPANATENQQALADVVSKEKQEEDLIKSIPF